MSPLTSPPHPAQTLDDDPVYATGFSVLISLADPDRAPAITAAVEATRRLRAAQ